MPKGQSLADPGRKRLWHNREIKQEFGTIEPPTVRGYCAEANTICRHIGNVRLGSLAIAFELGLAERGR